MSLDDVDPTFVQDLLNSDKYVDMAIDYYLRSEYRVSKPVTKIRPNVKVFNQYSDHGDFLVIGKGWVDVKHREHINFPPYPYGTVFICNVHAFQKHPMWQYFILNKKATHALIIGGDTSRDWNKVTCQSRGRDRSFYEAPYEMFKLVDL